MWRSILVQLIFINCWKLFLSLPTESRYITLLMMYYHTAMYFSDYKIWKVHENLLKYKSLEEEFNNFKNTFFLTIIRKQLLLPVEVFCVKTLLILAMRMLHFDIVEEYMAAAYIFLNYNCIWAHEIYFLDRWEQPESVS